MKISYKLIALIYVNVLDEKKKVNVNSGVSEPRNESRLPPFYYIQYVFLLPLNDVENYILFL